MDIELDNSRKPIWVAAFEKGFQWLESKARAGGGQDVDLSQFREKLEAAKAHGFEELCKSTHEALLYSYMKDWIKGDPEVVVREYYDMFHHLHAQAEIQMDLVAHGVLGQSSESTNERKAKTRL